MERYDQGSLDRAYFGEYAFSIGRVLSEARQRSKGVKFIFVAAFFIYLATAIILYTLFSLAFTAFTSSDVSNISTFINDQAASLLSIPVLLPILAAIIMLGIKRAGDHKISLSALFDYYIDVWPLVLASILMNLLIMLGLLFFILPGIYLGIAYIFTFPLIIDKRLGIWEAMELSRKAVSKRWFKFFVFNLLMIFIVLISAIPFGIGLIWTLPLAFISYGILYRKIFGFYGEEVPLNPMENLQAQEN